jgi:hypothetical protein
VLNVAASPSLELDVSVSKWFAWIRAFFVAITELAPETARNFFGGRYLYFFIIIFHILY